MFLFLHGWGSSFCARLQEDRSHPEVETEAESSSTMVTMADAGRVVFKRCQKLYSRCSLHQFKGHHQSKQVTTKKDTAVLRSLVLVLRSCESSEYVQCRVHSKQSKWQPNPSIRDTETNLQTSSKIASRPYSKSRSPIQLRVGPVKSSRIS